MSFDANAVRRSFQQAASRYEDFDWLQWEVAQRLIEQPQLNDFQPERIVDVGCGTGRLTAALKQRWPKAQVLGMDFAPAMAQQTRRRSKWRRPIETVCGDLGALPIATRSVDLLICNLALQWNNDIEAVFNGWRRVLKPGGLLLFSSFGPDTLQELRAAWAAVDGQAHVSEFADLLQVGDWLMSSGFRDPVMSGETITATYADPMDLMRELKGLGAHNHDQRRARGLTGKAAFAHMREAYKRFYQDGRAPATWEIVYGAAWGPEEGQPVRSGGGEVATFSVEALRQSRNKRNG